jgi:transcriptional regulator GlxA family with amidase domain
MHLVVELGDAGPACRIVGVWTDLWTRTLAGNGQVFGIKLRPGACQALVSEPAKSQSNTRSSLHEPALSHALMTHPENAETLLAEWLREHRLSHKDTATAVAIVAFMQTSPLTRVDDVANAHGMSIRALQRLFATHVGASPKWVLRRFRLQEAAERVENGTAGQLADLAYSLGYADQAHLARDFRAATGKTLSGFSQRVWVE